jgi:Mg2+ and Co2+ transporter CorA
MNTSIFMDFEKNNKYFDDNDFENELKNQYDLLLSLECEEFSDLFKRVISYKLHLLSDIDKNQHKLFLLNQFLQELNNYNTILNTIETSKINKQMEFLTLLTALFVPGTFFTSIFSMNIQIPLQQSIVPTYDAFIGVCIFLVVTFVLFMMYYNRYIKK